MPEMNRWETGLERVQVAGALQLVDPHLDGRVERRAADQDPDGRRLALAGHGAEEPVVLDHGARRRGGRRGSAPNGSGSNTSPPPVRSHGHGAGLALVMSDPADPALQAARVLVGDDLGPYGAERAAQPGRELLAALDDLRGGHAVGQVDLEPPARPVLADGAGEVRPPNSPLRMRLVDLGDAQRARARG